MIARLITDLCDLADHDLFQMGDLFDDPTAFRPPPLG
jgi:hypothetical protein